MSGLVSLVGGGEHTPGCEAIDRTVLELAGLRRPDVAVILAASPRRRRRQKEDEARAWWARLGGRASCAYAGEADAGWRARDLVARADLIVLTGGRPWLLRDRLERDGLAPLVAARWQEGVPVAGSSAGAMALASAMWGLRGPAPLALRPGLGLAAGLLVAPHAGRHGIDTWAAFTQSAHPDLEVVSIADRTALLLDPVGRRHVVGEGTVTSHRRSQPRTRVFTDIQASAMRDNRPPFNPIELPGPTHPDASREIAIANLLLPERALRPQRCPRR